MSREFAEDAFYQNGLKFECVRCSNSCRHEPGYVFLTRNDLEALANHLAIAEERVLERYCRDVSIGFVERLSLQEKSNYDCIFCNESGCQVYDVRPLQCRSYPFWSSHLFSRATWDKEGENCPGINRGRIHSRKEIYGWLRRREIEPLLP